MGKAIILNTPGASDIDNLEVFKADFLRDPPTVTEGALDTFHRILVA